MGVSVGYSSAERRRRSRGARTVPVRSASEAGCALEFFRNQPALLAAADGDHPRSEKSSRPANILGSQENL